MDDPDKTTVFSAIDGYSDINGTSPRMSTPRSTPPTDTIYPARPAAGTVAADADPIRFEPTVFGAARRHWVLVVVTGIIVMIAAIGYSVTQAKVYQAQASVTVPLPVSSTATAADPGQYLDSQVVLLESQPVAEQAATIANGQIGAHRLDAADFSTSKGGSLSVTPPTTISSGTYGASIVTVSYKGPSAQVAEVGLQAILQAFDQAIASNIKAQANATIAGIDKAISGPNSASQISALQGQRTQAIVNEQANLAQTPTAAVSPTTLANGHWSRNAAIGLVVGLILGIALAYALAVRRRSVSGRQDPRAIYNAPMIAETPATRSLSGSAPLPVAAAPGSAAAEAFRFAAGSVNRVRGMHSAGSSLIFVSPHGDEARSMVVANLALAMAEAGMHLLVVDANVTRGGVTSLLLPGGPITGGTERVLGGARTLKDCVEPSPHNDRVSVLGADWTAPHRVLGVARADAFSSLLIVAKTQYDTVLIDGPAVLQVPDAFDVVSAADGAVIVVSSDDRVADHMETAEVLRSMGVDVLGYLYSRSSGRPVLKHGTASAKSAMALAAKNAKTPPPDLAPPAATSTPAPAKNGTPGSATKAAAEKGPGNGSLDPSRQRSTSR